MVEDLRRLITSASSQERPIMFIGFELGSMISRFYTQIYERLILKVLLKRFFFKPNLFIVMFHIWY